MELADALATVVGSGLGTGSEHQLADNGPVVVTRALGVEVYAMFGPDALELVFKNPDGAFSSRRGWSKFVDRVNRAFVDAVNASIALLRVDLWPLPYAKGLRGRRFLVERFRALLDDKRREHLPDLFSQMCHAESEEGERFEDDEIIDHMIFVMIGGPRHLDQRPDDDDVLPRQEPVVAGRLRRQAFEAPGDELGYEGLQRRQELGWAMMEALRIHPPLAVMPRTTVTPVEFAGHTIPANALVSLAPILTHHDPSIYPDPERFDPLRFSPERAEHKRHRFAYAPFGGGAHVCIGQHFAALEVKAVMHRLLRRYRWSVPPDYQMRPYQHMPIAKPRDGLPLRLERL